MIQAGALWDDESAVLLDQGGIPESEHCGVIPKCPDGSVHVAFLDCR